MAATSASTTGHDSKKSDAQRPVAPISSASTHDDGRVRAIYRDDDSDPERDPDAAPGVRPESERDTGTQSFTLDVDGEVFSVRSSEFGGTDYTWLTGPNPGYGFSVSPASDDVVQHRANIRDFLSMIDPRTGYIGDD